MINGFNSRCLHVITGKPYRETAMNPDFDLVLAVRRRRLRFLGHVLRMNDSRLVKRTFLAYVYGSSSIPAGSLLEDCNTKNLEELLDLARDKKKWSELCERL
jgi:hypothetical protein